MGRTLLRGMFEAGLLSPSQAWAAAQSQQSCDEVTTDLGIPCLRSAPHDPAPGYVAQLASTDVILICVKPKQAPDVVQALAGRLPGMRGIYAGRLRNAAQVEALTVNLVSVNRRYKAHAGIRVTDV